jgi:hypothetical protein
MLVLLIVAVTGATPDVGGCSDHGNQRVTTLGGRCAVLVPSR